MLPAITTVHAVVLLCLQSLVISNPLPTNDEVDNNNILDLGVSLGVTLVTGEPEVSKYRGKRAAVEVAPEQEGLVVRQTGDAAEALRLHNAKRSGRGIPALTWDSSLASAAQSWANTLAQRNRMEHSPGSSRPNQGENLAYAWSSGTISNPMSQGTQAWLAEEKDYNNEIIPQGNFGAYGHYTQCMWRNTQRVGIAVARSSNGAFYTVARYSPQGNIQGQRPY